MKKISKILTLVLALRMVLALAACGSSAAPAATTAPAADGDAAADTGAAAPAIDWPKKNVTIIVGYGAGGDTDLAARVLADALSNKLGAKLRRQQPRRRFRRCRPYSSCLPTTATATPSCLTSRVPHHSGPHGQHHL